MNKNDTNITFSSHLNDTTIYFCEDTAFVESVGKKFGVDVNKDYFLAISFLYPSDVIATYENKHALTELLTPAVAYGPLNRFVDFPQFITCDKGTAPFLAVHTKEELLNASTMVCDRALELLKKSLPDVFIRIGIDTLGDGLADIEHTYQNSLRAANAGEKFKKERHVLDFIGAEMYSAVSTMVLTHGQSLIGTVLLQLTNEEQTILGKYYKCKEQVPTVVTALRISEAKIRSALCRVKEKTGLDVNDTGDNLKLNFTVIAKKMLEKEKKRR